MSTFNSLSLFQRTSFSAAVKTSKDRRRAVVKKDSKCRQPNTWPDLPCRCQVGDVVDVKLWVKRTLENPPSLPDAAATEQELHEFAVIQAGVR